MAWRKISNAVDYRTMYAAIIPRNAFHGDSLWTARPKILSPTGRYTSQHTDQELGYLCGVFNSLPFDWYIRPLVRLNITKTIIDTVPVPIYDKSNSHHAAISRLSMGLMCESNQHRELRQKHQIEIFHTQEQKLWAETQISAHVAIIYDLDITELEYICKQFRVFSVKRPNFMQNVLKNYNAMAL